MKLYLTIILLLSMIISSNDLLSQITSSPYSIFGVGTIEGINTGINSAMGGTGIALSSGHSLNLINPAAAVTLDSLISVFELGFSSKYETYLSNRTRQSSYDANFTYLAMGFRIAPNWVITAGINPYSTIGYNINVMTPIEGTTQEFKKTYIGDGGINEVYLGNSVRINRNLSIGIKALYLFGTVTKEESSEDFYYDIKENIFLSNFNLNYGLNYRFSANKWHYNLGIMYDNGKILITSKETSVMTSLSRKIYEGTVNDLKIPRSFGIGFSIEKNYFRLGLDYELRQWKNISFSNPLLESRNSNRYSLGAEFPSQGVNKGGSKMILYRFGVQYCESFVIVDTHPINYCSISFGAGIPLKGFLSVINLGVEIGRDGLAGGGLFREDFYTLHASISLKDLWFIKQKYF